MTNRLVEALANLSGSGGSLARSAAALLEAEAEQLRFDLARNQARFLRLVLLAAFVFGAVFWALGALLFAAGAGLARVLPPWAASLAVAAGLLALAFILLRVVRARARRLESPLGIVRRRVGSHLAFWRGVLENERDGGSPTAGTDGDDDGDGFGETP